MYKDWHKAKPASKRFLSKGHRFAQKQLNEWATLRLLDQSSTLNHLGSEFSRLSLWCVMVVEFEQIFDREWNHFWKWHWESWYFHSRRRRGKGMAWRWAVVSIGYWCWHLQYIQLFVRLCDRTSHCASSLSLLLKVFEAACTFFHTEGLAARAWLSEDTMTVNWFRKKFQHNGELERDWRICRTISWISQSQEHVVMIEVPPRFSVSYVITWRWIIPPVLLRVFPTLFKLPHSAT